MSIALLGVISCKGDRKCCSSQSKCAHAEAPACPKKGKKVIVARVAVKSGQEAAFIGVASKLVEATRQEAGNLFYSLYMSPLNPTEFIFYEEYKDDAAFQAHSESAHFAAFADAIKDMTAGDLIVDQF
jgi:quinol monooxygenase YgiN